MDIVDQLNERTALRYMGDCKCGKCHLVPVEYITKARDEIEQLRSFMMIVKIRSMLDWL